MTRIIRILALIVVAVSITNAQQTDTWTQLPDFSGEARDKAISFTVNNKAYVGTGQNSSGARLNDFWEFDAATSTWSQRADASGVPRSGAIGFAIGSKGYMGTGSVATNVFVNDFYEYDPPTNVWTLKPSVGSWGRSLAVAFVLKNKGHVALGIRNGGVGFVYDDTMWQYDPTTSTWTPKASFPGPARDRAAAFTLSGIGYVVGGANNYQEFNEVWAYSITNNTWTLRLSNFPPGVNQMDVSDAFTVGNRGYILVAGHSSSDRWLMDYNATTNALTLKAQPPSLPYMTAAYNVGALGFYATGGFHTKNVFRYLSDELRVSGPDLVCYSNNTFSLNFVHPGSSIVWTKSNNLTYASGQGTSSYVVSGNTSGAGWVRADVSYAGTSYYQQKDFWVGPYGASNYPISGPAFACTNSYLTYFVTPPSGATNYNWSWPSDWTYVSGQGTNTIALVSSANSGAVIVRVDNACGPGGSPAVKFTQINSCGGFAMQTSPNPASDILKITLSGEDQIARTGPSSYDGSYFVSIVDSRLKQVFAGSSTKSPIEITVSELPEGLYFVNVHHRGQKLQEQIRIER